MSIHGKNFMIQNRVCKSLSAKKREVAGKSFQIGDNVVVKWQNGIQRQSKLPVKGCQKEKGGNKDER